MKPSNCALCGRPNASVPLPLPRNRGEPVTPALVSWLESSGHSDVVPLIQARADFGLAKYGQPLMSGDGRDTLEDARQEAGDLLQYLFKARMTQTDVSALLPAIRACIALFEK